MDIETEITYNDITLIVHGYYTQGEDQTHNYIGSPSEFEIYEVYTETNEVNIFDILNFNTIDNIEVLSLEQIENK